MLDLGSVIIDDNGSYETVYINREITSSMDRSYSSVSIGFQKKYNSFGSVDVKIKDGGRTTKERIDVIEKSVINYLKTRPDFYYDKSIKVLFYDGSVQMYGCKTVVKKTNVRKRTTSKPTTRKTVRK